MGRSSTIKPPEIAGYECEALLGEGATGYVYRARYHGQPVALKVLKRLGVNRNLLGYSLNRLRNLPQHPGVVEIIDFSMEGKPLYQATGLYVGSSADAVGTGGYHLEPWCGRLSPDMAWAVIRRLCEAMAHLHTHGVMHCSLNPKNIMVEDLERPAIKVTDFAQGWLAEISHIDFSESFLYAPPEQLREPKKMFEGQAQHWDVYAFGATAYRLLYQRFSRAQDWIASMQQGAMPFHPLALADALEREPEIAWPEPEDPFEAQRLGVLRQCLQLDPEARYNDMREVLDQFERIDRDEKHALEKQASVERERVLGEKVAAGEKRWRRFRLAAVALATALIGSVVLNVTSESRLAQRGQEIVDLKESSQQALDAAQKQEARAEGEAARLKSNLTYSQATADTFLEFLLNAKNPNSPEYQSIDGYLESAQEHYQRVLQATESDAALIGERLRAQFGLARIESQLGKDDASRERLKALRKEIEGLSEAARQLPEVEQTLGAAWLETGRAEVASGQRQQGLESLQESVKIFKKQLAVSPNDPNLKRRLGKSLFYFGQELSRSGELKTALKSQQSAMQVLETVAQSAVAREEDEYYLAQCQFEVGLIRVWENQGIEAWEAFQLSSRGYSRLMDEKPQIPEYRFQLARCLYYLGDLSFQEKGDEEDSALARHSMRELLLLLLQKDEANRDYQFYLALVLVDLAEMARDQGDRAGATSDLEKALAILSELHKKDARDVDVTFRLALAKAAHGDLLLDADQTAEALKEMGEAEALFAEIDESGLKAGVPDHVYRFRVATVASGRGHAFEVHQESEKAAGCFKRAEEILGDLAGQRPNDIRIRDALEAVGTRSAMASQG